MGVSVKLNDRKCKTAQGQERPYKLTDGGGLYLLITPDGAKYWRLKYRFLKKEKLLALGSYPTVSLLDAREKREEAKKQLLAGKDPSIVKQDRMRNAILASKNTFEVVALEWIEKECDHWTPKYAEDLKNRLKKNVFPFIGTRPIADITPVELLHEVLKRVENRKKYYLANRLRQECGQIFRFGVATSRCDRDITHDLKDALKTKPTKSFAALTADELPPFLKILEKNEMRLFPQTIRGIKLLMLTFTRTSELIKARRDTGELDLEKGIWEVPLERMKKRRAHIVPLSKQAIELFREQLEETSDLNTPFVFPHSVEPRKCMSNNTILSGIGRMGYKGEMTGHGFRALAMSTIKEKLDYRHEVIDRQLAHVQRSKTDQAYDRAQFLDERTKMMQEWADFIDGLYKGNSW